MNTCFIIQPFDGGPYDKRCDDVFIPAIEDAGLQSYRVDRDPSASIPIEQIESGIRSASLCLADITEDNPNVWFELGYAIATRTDVILVCSDQRKKAFPFDVQHRHIIKYTTESSRDFEQFKTQITDRLKALLKKQEKLSNLETKSPVTDVEGLNQQEIVALVAIGQNLDTPEDRVSTYLVRQDMEKLGYTRIATTLALASLRKQGFIESKEELNYNGESYIAYTLENAGMDWLLKNQDRLVLHQQAKQQSSVRDEDVLPF
ncbi:hypothetical protein [Prosthecochloris sp.]|uniref:hypothetical protein n=1 Tax=Prosthecochloris sp. TaxID=290513 RepID=UPI0025EAD7C9|nr:hypothetical protein [Prosthecochloris sp.]